MGYAKENPGGQFERVLVSLDFVIFFNLMAKKTDKNHEAECKEAPFNAQDTWILIAD